MVCPICRCKAIALFQCRLSIRFQFKELRLLQQAIFRLGNRQSRAQKFSVFGCSPIRHNNGLCLAEIYRVRIHALHVVHIFPLLLPCIVIGLKERHVCLSAMQSAGREGRKACSWIAIGIKIRDAHHWGLEAAEFLQRMRH